MKKINTVEITPAVHVQEEVDTMKKVKFYCDELRGHTLFQVIEQDGIDSGYYKIVADNGVSINSIHVPAIHKSKIFIGGKSVKDTNTLVSTNKMSKEKILETFKSLVKEGSFEELGNNEYLVEWED